jgi:hypothetical protein
MYRLQQLAAGSYDLDLDGEVIGSVVRSGSHHRRVMWHAELFNVDGVHPPPFTQGEHEFETLDELISWLGDAEVIPTYQSRPR